MASVPLGGDLVAYLTKELLPPMGELLRLR